MNIATWTFVGLALVTWIAAYFLHRAARGTDDFGAGLLFWVACGLGVVFTVVAVLLWLASLYASGFR